MEFPFIPSIVNEDGFTTDQIMGDRWTASRKVHVDAGEGEEILIKLEDVVLKLWRGKCMAKARIEQTGEILTTNNWEK
ncbi:hypothetical protein CLAFUW4_07012 [Fulvia fulva]|uniref:Uncharacterized protein n=1 Tax=Passalora fulva TaxID=5499 RepID=A0A9Q8PBC9_PASFU|nr:uncharacterized protein CLAFUR5_07148 [Fulvia fulva]KAK4621947.1 hypothetical protein CLAFUR4_07021 [Fulvia fulva]KAK4623302.1 hypothetical protein CLAFUR0_07019 [Fulvia fulva]UJO19355.1 hypothetical protein CLAFUR5_07148 [Fulvia fulva]WPV16555.1 hypothetical protein CLAFUW4_07012 [Fulvia fulva]WPV31088.1 hypothetical protein CLAFUW7_07012 [Fulvia fulva]